MKYRKSTRVRATRLALVPVFAVAGVSIFTSTPASAHEFCDAQTEFSYDDEGQISQVTTQYTTLSDLGEDEGAVDGLCQARVVVDCLNDAGEVRTIFGNWSNGNSSVQAADCPSSFPVIGAAGHYTAYDGNIFPA